jgi:hypothetical protein
MCFRPRPSAAGVPAGGSEVSLSVSLFVLLRWFYLFIFPSLSRFMRIT